MTTIDWTLRDADSPERAVAFGSLDAVFALEGEWVAGDSESEVLRVVLGEQRFYVKRYFATKGLRSWLGFGRIRVEARNQLWFEQWGLPAARVVAYGQERVLTKTVRGALITEALENTRDLATLAHEQSPLLRNGRWVRMVSAQVADVARTLHTQRFAHNDLKWRNVLVTLDVDAPQIGLIDCPAGQRWWGPMLRHRIIKDLACLDKVAKYQLSRTQRLRFFKQYRKIARLSAADKQMIGRILAFFRGRE